MYMKEKSLIPSLLSHKLGLNVPIHGINTRYTWDHEIPATNQDGCTCRPYFTSHAFVGKTPFP